MGKQKSEQIQNIDDIFLWALFVVSLVNWRWGRKGGREGYCGLPVSTAVTEINNEKSSSQTEKSWEKEGGQRRD